MNSEIQKLLRGSFDLHVHAAPDSQERRMDALETSRSAYEAEMGGFVLKSHEYPTAPLAYALRRMYPGLKVFGAIVLNRSVGGINPEAVQVSANLGAKVVCMPTYDANHWRERHENSEGIKITDNDCHLTEKSLEIIEIVAKNEMVLASGHISPSETITLFDEAQSQGITKMIATHSHGSLTEDEMLQMVSLGSYMERTFLECMSSSGNMTPSTMVQIIRRLGVDKCIVTTDFGQWMNPPPSEGMRMAIATLLEAGMSTEEITKLVKTNPSELVE